MRHMRFWAFLILCAGVGLLTGCAALDWAFGLDEDGNAPEGSRPGGPESPAGSAGGLLNMVVPWASAGIGVLGGLYANIRKKQYHKALASTARGVNVFREEYKRLAAAEEDEDKKKLILDTVGRLFERLAEEQALAGSRQLVREVVATDVEGK